MSSTCSEAAHVAALEVDMLASRHDTQQARLRRKVDDPFVMDACGEILEEDFQGMSGGASSSNEARNIPVVGAHFKRHPVAMVAEFDLLQPGRARTATFWKVWPFISIWIKEQRLFARAEPSESSDDEPALPFATSCCVCMEAEVQAARVCYYCDQWLCAGCYHRDFDRHARCVGCRERGIGRDRDD